MKQTEVCFHPHMVFLMGQILSMSPLWNTLYARMKYHIWFHMFRKDLGPLGQHLGSFVLMRVISQILSGNISVHYKQHIKLNFIKLCEGN